MHPVMRLPPDADTQALRKALWRYRIGHRITAEDDAQVLWVADPGQREALVNLVARWQQGESLELAEHTSKTDSPALLSTLKRLPVTVAMVAISLIVFVLLGQLYGQVMSALSIIPTTFIGRDLVSYGSLSDTLASGQVWRLLSPAFLHFGWMHLIFNLMWVWYFGRQVEALQGGRTLLLLLVVAGVGANLAQYATGTVLFGGMSGVVYALLAHVWLMSRRVPGSGFFVPQMLVVFMLGWMVFTMTEMAGLVGFGNVANEAHLGGLLVGLVTGWYYSARRLRS